ncbi:hypothetical protein O9993_06895 [Vibrio lentus]|nr:hypothetical protein [Vibrio lentus]
MQASLQSRAVGPQLDSTAFVVNISSNGVSLGHSVLIFITEFRTCCCIVGVTLSLVGFPVAADPNMATSSTTSNYDVSVSRLGSDVYGSESHDPIRMISVS